MTHIGARYYDPGLGQFISPDPLLFTEVPQQFHPYNYANANPTTLTDPTGLSVFSGMMGGGGLLASFGLRFAPGRGLPCDLSGAHIYEASPSGYQCIQSGIIVGWKFVWTLILYCVSNLQFLSFSQFVCTL